MQYAYRCRPSTVATMLRALARSPGLGASETHASLAATWNGHRPSLRHLGQVRAACGQPVNGLLPLVYPWIVSFPLQMSLLTRPLFPKNITRLLQIRYHQLQHQAPREGATLDMALRLVGQRVLERGVEFDFYGTVHADGAIAWESLNTYYARGRFGPLQADSLLSQAPEFADDLLAEWTMAAGGGLRNARLTADYNPLHWAPWAARRQGYRGAFCHPQVVSGQCLARLPAPQGGRPVRLDVWLKGPVYYGLPVRLCGGTAQGGVSFGLFCDEEPRPALVGRLCDAAPGSTIVDGAAGFG